MRTWMGVMALVLVGCTGGSTTGEICGDGNDNDGDGFADCDDLECAADASCEDGGSDEEDDCGNGDDDDDDGDVDCDDSDCDGDADCEDAEEDCDNGVDDDGDGNADCDDAECATHVDCQGDAEDCDNGVDDDGDGRTDCADSDCASDPACSSSENCTNGSDDDGDGDVDCDDSDCASHSACQVTYTDYDGTEVFTYGIADSSAGAAGVDCLVHWNTTGTPIAPCSGCEFAFDVTLAYSATDSTDNGVWSSCPVLQTDWSYAYAYTDDYYGYGSYALFQDSYGAWSPWAQATFDGTTFSYTSGDVDYYYSNSGGYYPDYTGAVLITFYYDGFATVQ